MKTFLGQVIALVADAFKNETDKSGQPYVLHCIAVMEGARNRGLSCPFELAAAFAHDLAEDQPGRMLELIAICDRHAGGEKTVDWVYRLSRDPEETYQEFIDRIVKSGQRNLIKIKMADIEHNSQLTRLKGVTDNDLSRAKKYVRSYSELDAALKLLQTN